MVNNVLKYLKTIWYDNLILKWIIDKITTDWKVSIKYSKKKNPENLIHSYRKNMNGQ
jgi:hypothetical protein